MKFVHKVSKGTRFNQIYIPKEMERVFEVGDLVEIKLIEKKSKLYYSKNLKKLGEFKERLIQEIFNSLKKFNEIKQIFVVGSFLTKIDYNDIDLILVLKDKALTNKNFKDKLNNILISKLQFRFHLLLIPENKFFELEKICPLTRNMLFYFVSDKPFEISKETILDKNHIKFLLMMPEDLLEIKSNSRVFYDNLRRIITIEMFLENKTYNLDVIESELKKLFGEALFNYLRNNEPIDDKIITNLREIIKSKLKKIKSKLEEV